MTTNTLQSDEACALLLQRPLISDVSSTAYSVLPNGSVQAHAFFTAPNRPRMGVQANGVGLHCRWMLTDASLIIARPDRSFVAKPRPPGLPYTAGYRNVFSFSTTHSDMIVLSGNVNTHVVCVHASGMDEHTLALGVRCFAGHGSNTNAYTLLGQTPRSANGDAGTPIAVSVTDTGFQARHLQAPAPVELESWVAVLPAAQSLLLVGAQRPPPPQMQDYEGLTTPLPADHEAWWVMRSQVEHSVGQWVGQPLAIRNARFVACAGARNQERAFFQIGGTGVTPGAQASLMSLDASGEQSLHHVSGLPEGSLVSHIQFDPLVGWLGIAQAQGTEHRGYVLRSRDGVAWAAANAAAAVSA
jgi:hypothetical protein